MTPEKVMMRMAASVEGQRQGRNTPANLMLAHNLKFFSEKSGIFKNG
ncbi:hypothetical protein OQ252_08835 [Acetobacter farinalis]|uniref:Uncharacterized protein n=1 Tax=Acetobacter farinalis TaxID=1260984 RepID=A0ABT3Q8A6_9PROT|nr:hypothetical protein [Acetobacter farinalis]MCX2561497.1 hypothetical protein [Acetobacter farinalis]NHO30436.1 hypothetical protein [Acetobacter farinalis]